MKGKLISKKGKLIALSICAALILAMGTISAFAASSEGGLNLPSLFRMDENGASYSSDGGNTWTNGTPEGYYTKELEDGGRISWVGDPNPPAHGSNGNFFGMKVDDGNTLYSTDGETWSETAPDSFTVNDDGSVSIGNDGALPSGGSLVRRDENGASYSTDGGNTWTNGTPDGMYTKELEDGGRISWVGDPNPPAPGSGGNFFGMKMEDGKTFYTTDGSTWNENAPNGFSQNSDGSVSFRK